tara:strand:+ start:288 stop:572 length:285 start_codon:yes stop_codon:yes gene_type:complete
MVACQSEVDEAIDNSSTELTENDIYEIINDGYYSYLDSIGREPKIHFQPILLIDTSFCENLETYLKDKPMDKVFVHPPNIYSPVPFNNFDNTFQ